MDILLNVHMPPEFEPLLCTVSEKDAVLTRLSGPMVRLHFQPAAGPHLLPHALFEQARGMSVTRVYDGAIKLLALVVIDRPLLATRGIDQPWEARYRRTADAVYGLAQLQILSGHQAGAARLLAADPRAEAEERVRRLLTVARAGRQREILGIDAADLASWEGVHDAVWRIHGLVLVPGLREILLACGATAEELDAFAPLAWRLRQDRNARMALDTQAAQLGHPLIAGRAMLLGDAGRVSNLMRTVAPQHRWPHYQLSALFELGGGPARADGSAGAGTGPAPGGPTAGGPRPAGEGTPGRGPVPGVVTGGGGGAGPPGAAGAGGLAGQAGAGPGAAPGQAGAGAAAGRGATAPAAPGGKGGTDAATRGEAADHTSPMGQGASAPRPGGGAAAPASGSVPAGGAVDGTAGGVTPASALAGGRVDLPPGTILYTRSADGGPGLTGVVRTDGTVAWSPTVLGPEEERPAAPRAPAQRPRTPRHRRR